MLGRRSSGGSQSSGAGSAAPGAPRSSATGGGAPGIGRSSLPLPSRGASQSASRAAGQRPMPATAAPITKHGDWRLIPAKTPDAKPFWYNKATKAKQWGKPAEVVAAEQQQSQSQGSAARAAPSSPPMRRAPQAPAAASGTATGLATTTSAGAGAGSAAVQLPSSASGSAAPSPAPITKLGDWRLIPAKTPTGKPFWYNKATKAK